jgi:tRNA-splicing ligase RtcB
MPSEPKVEVWGDPVDPVALKQIENCARGAAGAALMADHHVGYAMPIGGVVAYRDEISPSGVGFDIACGNKAVLLDASAAEVRRDIARIMDEIFRRIPFGVGKGNAVRVDHELFDDPAWSIPIAARHRTLAQAQLGTVGSGNHYVDLFADEQDRVWIGVHFGSRGFGHHVAKEFIQLGGGKDGMMVDPVRFGARSPLGEDYLACMNLAGRYAYAGRDWVCEQVRQIVGARAVEEVHNHHNFAWRETHRGQEVWVVRKGATPAFPGQRGFVGGSMGDVSVILEGVAGPEAERGWHSTVHGAGRVLSRTRAAGKRRKGGRTGGEITRRMMLGWVREMGVELRGAGTDESPHCYKRLPEVLAHHAASIRVVHTLTPLGVAMAGDDVFDPYAD